MLSLSQLLHAYGYWFIAVVVGVERVGLPLPGEAALIVGAAFAASSTDMRIEYIVLTALAAAIIGNVAGYCLGKTGGVWLISRFGPKVGFTPSRFRLGQYIFKRYGIAVVTFGQFLPLVRTLAAVLAGVNGIPWWPFLIASISGALIWSAVFGFGAYWLGKQAEQAAGSAELVFGVLVTIVVVLLVRYLRKNEQLLQVKADRAFSASKPIHVRID
jgi:membrane protein DedA with SNARE-associated domain